MRGEQKQGTQKGLGGAQRTPLTAPPMVASQGRVDEEGAAEIVTGAQKGLEPGELGCRAVAPKGGAKVQSDPDKAPRGYLPKRGKKPGK